MSLQDHVVKGYRMGLWLIKETVKDLTDEQMVQQPKPGMNHAAWLLGHFCLERVFFSNVAPVNLEAPAGWKELFMPGSTPVAELGKYPTKAVFLKELEATQAAVEKAFLGMSEADMEKPTTNERMKEIFRSSLVQSRSADFQDKFTATEEAANSLHLSFLITPFDSKRADAAFQRVNDGCAACHKAFRN